MTEKMQEREVIFEFRQVGSLVRVMAMDIATTTEVLIQGPVSAGEEVLRKNALLRLEYVLRKAGIVS